MLSPALNTVRVADVDHLHVHFETAITYQLHTLLVRWVGVLMPSEATRSPVKTVWSSCMW